MNANQQLSSREQTITETALDKKIELINKARKVLGGEQWNDTSLSALYTDLVNYDQFGYASELLQKKIEDADKCGHPVPLKDYQTLAKYIYKDHSLPSAFKFEKALDILKAHDPLTDASNCETFGLAGAIYKRKWQYDHQFKNLIFSRFYYKKGYDLWKRYLDDKGNLSQKHPCNDKGFTAINYAYVSELMSVDRLEEHGKVTGVSKSIHDRLEEAETERWNLLKALLQDVTSPEPQVKEGIADQWTMPTIAEAFFGIRQYKQALTFIQKSIVATKKQIELTANPDDVENMLAWEMRTFQMQLNSIAYLQLYQKKYVAEVLGNQPTTAYEAKIRQVASETNPAAINKCLAAFSEEDKDRTDIAVKKDGKLGLALSGGGFRASLFHIGVLAALAENNQLKNVEIISCVSGGSIIGAYYYFKLKALLEHTADEDISQQAYIDIIKETEQDFLKGVQFNLRVRVVSSFRRCMKMLFNKHYSRTHRIGELYDKYLFQPLWKKDDRYRQQLQNNSQTIFMRDLFIKPAGQEKGFEMMTENWKRNHKIPQLVLNATSVNTGHNWQFTASWMGEPPGNIQTDVDVKPRLRRMYYEEAPEQYKNFRLCYAVGASSCVPVMFTPMPMYDLYEKVDLQLIDGGLHDNQGIAALIEQECRNMIISDASGQMPTNNAAAGNEASVFYRADNILQERLRELQFMDIKERSKTSQLNTLLGIHLKKGLQKYPVKWIGSDDPARRIFYANIPDEETVLTEYGILLKTQNILSEIRTDLDSFNDTEAYALMYSGYRQTLLEIEKQGLTAAQPLKGNWNFEKISAYVTSEKHADETNRILAVGKNLTFKVIALNKPLRTVLLSAAIAGLLVALYAGYLFINKYWGHWNDEAFTYQLSMSAGAVAILVGAFVAGFFSKTISNLINIRSFAKKKLVIFFVMTGLCIFAKIYLLFFNGLYNRAGRLKEELKKINNK